LVRRVKSHQEDDILCLVVLHASLILKGKALLHSAKTGLLPGTAYLMSSMYSLAEERFQALNYSKPNFIVFSDLLNDLSAFHRNQIGRAYDLSSHHENRIGHAYVSLQRYLGQSFEWEMTSSEI
jgi:hypothetical protein